MNQQRNEGWRGVRALENRLAILNDGPNLPVEDPSTAPRWDHRASLGRLFPDRSQQAQCDYLSTLTGRKKTLRVRNWVNQQSSVNKLGHGVGQTTAPNRKTTADVTKILFLRVWLGLVGGKHRLFANAFLKRHHRPNRLWIRYDKH